MTDPSRFSETDPLRDFSFEPGLEFSRGFFFEAVRPVLDAQMPGLAYSAALIGPGSDVLGFDTEMSLDHDWGPRVVLFLRAEDRLSLAAQIRSVLDDQLPVAYKGFPVRCFAPHVRNIADRHRLKPGSPGMIPRVEIYTIHEFIKKNLGVDLDRSMSPVDWLTIPHQKLRSIVAGSVFHDNIGLQQVRDLFSWYPHDIWLYILASCWARIGEDEVLTGRAGSVGDELGSLVIAWRLIGDLMRLAFLMEQSYPPYAKWLGSAFKQLRCAPSLHPMLERVSRAANWQERDGALAAVYSKLAEMHNDLRITPPISCEPTRFWQRPFTIIRGGSIARTLHEAIQDPAVRKIADKWLIGNVDLFSDSTILRDDPARRSSLFGLYE